MSKAKYKVGDKFNAVLTISDVDDDGEGELVEFWVEDLFDRDGDRTRVGNDQCIAFNNLDEAFDPLHRERKKQMRIAELEKELGELKDAD